jgi:hypothetical protein
MRFARNVAAMKTKRGGPGRGQGRPPVEAGQLTVTVSLRMTARQRQALASLGGAQWVRKKIDYAVDRVMRNDTDETARPSLFVLEFRQEAIEHQADADHAAHGYHMDATDMILCGSMVSCGSVFPYPFPSLKNR